MKVKEKNERADLKLNSQEIKIIVSGSITSWQICGKIMETVTNFLFYLAPKSLQMVTAAMKLRDLLLGRKAMTNLLLLLSHFSCDC